MNSFTYDYPVRNYFGEGLWTRHSTPRWVPWAGQ